MGQIIEKWDNLTNKLQNLFSFSDYVQLWMRLWVAKIFFDSGRTKAGEGFLEINDFQGTLFEEEYGISFIDPELMAQLALYAETLLPLALLFGFASRLSALGLLGMTLFIEIFVYPEYYWQHVTWASALIFIIAMGAGKISVDSLIRRKLK